jgi:hypothetical protein
LQLLLKREDGSKVTLMQWNKILKIIGLVFLVAGLWLLKIMGLN